MTLSQSGPSAILEELIHHRHEESGENSHEQESLESGLMELVHQAEEGAITADEDLEQMESLLERGEMKGHDEHGHDDAHRDENGHDHSAGDPHFWQDPILAIHYVERIRNGLVEADPDNAQVYTANAEAYIQELRELDREIAQTLEAVPPEHRHLVTFHDAFGYFRRRYGWQVSAFVPSDASDITPGAVRASSTRYNRKPPGMRGSG
jgi:ABC-type Zn uptake system ZnuABC Zn-binding protein ZnuA